MKNVTFRNQDCTNISELCNTSDNDEDDSADDLDDSDLPKTSSGRRKVSCSAWLSLAFMFSVQNQIFIWITVSSLEKLHDDSGYFSLVYKRNRNH